MSEFDCSVCVYTFTIVVSVCVCVCVFIHSCIHFYLVLHRRLDLRAAKVQCHSSDQQQSVSVGWQEVQRQRHRNRLLWRPVSGWDGGC